MKKRMKYIALLITAFLTLNSKMSAQQVASAVMNVSVEIVSGSAVEIHQNNLITFHEIMQDPVNYAVLTIRHQEDSHILTSTSESILMVNGVEQFEFETNMIHHVNDSGEIELHFTGNAKSEVQNGKYSGVQIAEIIYL